MTGHGDALEIERDLFRAGRDGAVRAHPTEPAPISSVSRNDLDPLGSTRSLATSLQDLVEAAQRRSRRGSTAR